jgi:iron complex outermembrane receptor protein
MPHSVTHTVTYTVLRAAWLAAPAAFAPALLPSAAHAQVPAVAPAEARPGTVTGVVVDSASGRPLPAAQVRLLGLNRGELTHDDGTFAFEGLPAGRYAVAVQRVGYAAAEQAVTVTPGGRATVRLALTASAARLAPVVVTGGVGEGRERDALRPTRVVGGAELDRRLGETVAATLQSQPGVTVSSLGPNTARPVIRGLSGDRVLVLEDGLRPGDLSTTSADHAVSVDPLTARQLEVVRGPNSLLYGPSALGGVVNVVRDEIPTTPLEHAHGIAVAQGATANRGTTAGGSVAAPVGHVLGAHVAARVEGSARTGGDLRTPMGTLRNTGLRTYGGAGSLALVGARGHAGVAYRAYSNDYGIPGGFVGAHPGGIDVRMRRQTVRAEAERRFAGVEGAAADGRGLRVLGVPLTSARLTAGYTDYGHREIEASGIVGTRFAQGLGQADLLVRHGAVAGLTSGAAGARVQLRGVTTGGSLRTPSTDDVSAAAFLVEEARLGGVRLQGGVRYDYARYAPRTRAFVRVGEVNTPTEPRTFGAVSGSLGALVDAGAGVQFGASAARAYRTPDFNELYSDGPHLAAYTYDVGNPRLGRRRARRRPVRARHAPAAAGRGGRVRQRALGLRVPAQHRPVGPAGRAPALPVHRPRRAARGRGRERRVGAGARARRGGHAVVRARHAARRPRLAPGRRGAGPAGPRRLGRPAADAPAAGPPRRPL